MAFRTARQGGTKEEVREIGGIKTGFQ